MILSNKILRTKLGVYYKKSMKKTDYIKALLSEPSYKQIDISKVDMTYYPKRKLICDVVPEYTKITIVLKPTNSLNKRIDKVYKYIKDSGFDILEKYVVTNFSQMIDELYFGGPNIARYVVTLYKTDIELKQRTGQIIIITRKKETDLIKLKKDIRRITGFDFFILNVKGVEHLVGLNSIHIPDSENMIKETSIIRNYKNEN